MSFVDEVTPKDTEEVKPGLFIQKWKGKYRQIEPMAWNGKMRWEQQIRSILSLRTFFTIGVILFLWWAYVNDDNQYRDFYFEVIENPVQYCEQVFEKQGEVYLNGLGAIVFALVVHFILGFDNESAIIFAILSWILFNQHDISMFMDSHNEDYMHKSTRVKRKAGRR